MPLGGGDRELLAQSGWNRIVTLHFPLRGDPRLVSVEDSGGGQVEFGAFCMVRGSS